MALVCPLIFSSASHQLPLSHLKHHFPKPRFRVSCLSAQPEQINATKTKNSRPQEYQPSIFDNLFLNLFRNKMVQVRILRSLFPPLLLELYRMLITPIGGGKVAALMVARVTALSCQWLMGSCKVNSVNLPNGSSMTSGS